MVANIVFLFVHFFVASLSRQPVGAWLATQPESGITAWESNTVIQMNKMNNEHFDKGKHPQILNAIECMCTD